MSELILETQVPFLRYDFWGSQPAGSLEDPLWPDSVETKNCLSGCLHSLAGWSCQAPTRKAGARLLRPSRALQNGALRYRGETTRIWGGIWGATLPRMQPAKGVQLPLVLFGSLMNFEKWDYSTVRYSCWHSSHGNFVATASDTFYTVTLVTGIWDLWHHGLLSKVGEPGSKHFLDFDRLDLLCTAREATETSQGAVETETKPVAEGRDSNWMWLRKALQASSHKEYLRAGETPLTTFCFTSTWLQVWCGAC